MANKVRFVDNLKVGAYNANELKIFNNVDNRVTTATGNEHELNAEENLIFSGSRLGISTSTPQAKLDISGSINEDLLLVKNFENQGIEVDNKGILKLIEFEDLPTPQEGGIIYSKDNFFIGI